MDTRCDDNVSACVYLKGEDEKNPIWIENQPGDVIIQKVSRMHAS